MAIPNKNWLLLLIGFISGISSGLFGAGGGVIIVLMMTMLLQQEQHIAQATAISITFTASIVSCIIYFMHGNLQWQLIIPVAIGSVLGGYVGAKIMKKISAKHLKRFFGIFMIISGIRMMMG